MLNAKLEAAMQAEFNYNPNPIIKIAQLLESSANRLVQVTVIVGASIGFSIGVFISFFIGSWFFVFTAPVGAIIGGVIAYYVAQRTALFIRAQAAMLLLLVTVEKNTRRLEEIEKRLSQR
ncbi:MAG: hypothetical protein CUN51_04520 [Candidatus Thermofonsia Clade 1 bacterium]|uniref:Uncharacterized protein n=1 Tax=Candidatus Thermofonsia Clade 1 bacterium TaxID=2364210 RepID=A0A2M8P0R8_9CHLR|nr:MAG: hypothetical protein CUN51_04520 [Candidatus Thermofonsia Clade 1 bacterium]